MDLNRYSFDRDMEEQQWRSRRILLLARLKYRVLLCVYAYGALAAGMLICCLYIFIHSRAE